MAAKKTAKAAPPADAAEVVALLRRHGSKTVRDGMARFAIPSDRAFGIPMATMQRLAKPFAPNHALAQALWATGWYEARTIAAFIDDPSAVTPGQMDRWARDFDNWAICDTVCFKLFDQTPHAWAKVDRWAVRREEFVKRAAFALLASLASHDKKTGDDAFRRRLPLLERGAADERNFVKKGVSWALRAVARRPSLRAEVVTLAKRLAASTDPAPRWVGKDVLRQLKG